MNKIKYVYGVRQLMVGGRERESIEKLHNPIVVANDASEWQWCGVYVP